MLRVEEVLWGVHGFLDALGIDEVRARGQQDDKPLRMVKTLVYELCKALVRSCHAVATVLAYTKVCSAQAACPPGSSSNLSS